MSEARIKLPDPETPPKYKANPPDREVVTVACNIPNGLTLHLFKHRKIRVQGPGGSYEEDNYVRDVSEEVHINGSSVDFEALKRGEFNQALVGGAYHYALTFNVSRKFWDEWLTQNKDT